MQIYGRRKRPFTGYPEAKHPKHNKFAITDIQEKPGNFFCCSTRALMGFDFSLRNNFTNSGSFAKVSVPAHIYNSLV